jgi:hypothetical protein
MKYPRFACHILSDGRARRARTDPLTSSTLRRVRRLRARTAPSCLLSGTFHVLERGVHAVHTVDFRDPLDP